MTAAADPQPESHSDDVADATARSNGKNIVICSDGTGNVGGGIVPSNVWRIFHAVTESDQNVPYQLRFHDDGVGTHNFKLLKIVGGAFGWGISANLRELYQTLIHVHERGDRIFLLGFSRGAYTVRVLAQMICLFGIPSGCGRSPEQISRMASDALKNYKRGNEEFAARARSLKPAERQYDRAEYLQASSAIRKVRGDSEWNDQTDTEYPIHFLGCWDTVDAVGLPFEEMTQAFQSFFPLRFRSRLLNPGVRHAVQALALDDERRTFHPRLWKQLGTENQDGEQSIEQVWFAGMHSDVGGGYPRSQLALVSLVWMAEKATKCGLRLNESILAEWKAETSELGLMHDSRSGLAAYYRYHPRRIDLLAGDDSPPPVIHASVLDRIALSPDHYAPTAITTSTFRIEGNPRYWRPAADVQIDHRGVLTSDPPRTEMLETAHDYVWFGRVLYFVFVAWSFLFLGCGTGLTSGVANVRPLSWFVGLCAAMQSWVPLEDLVLSVSGTFLPALINSGLAGYDREPGLLTFMLLNLTILFCFSHTTRQLTKQAATKAWAAYRGSAAAPADDGTKYDIQSASSQEDSTSGLQCRRRLLQWCRPLARCIRTSQRIRQVASFWKNTLGPIFGGLVFFAVVLLLLSLIFPTVGRSLLMSRLPAPASDTEATAADSHDTLEAGTKSARVLKVGESEEMLFHTNQIWGRAPVEVRQGHFYRITVSHQGWFDDSLTASPDGLVNRSDSEQTTSPGIARYIQRYGKRITDQPIFKLMATIGSTDTQLIPIGIENCFKAEQSGPLYLFVNDVPGFYSNNHGNATITIRRTE